MSYVKANQLVLPPLRFEVASGSSILFQTFACATQGGQIVELMACGPVTNPNSCLQTSELVTATATDNKFTCLLAGNVSPDPTFMVRISSPNNPPARYYSTYVKSTDGVSIFVDRVQFTSSGGSISTMHTLSPEYYSAAAQQGAVNIDFVVPNFSTFNWVQWVPFSGWDAYGTLGGIIFFSYILHALCMQIAGIWLLNPWDSRQTASLRELQPLNASPNASKQGYTELPEPRRDSAMELASEDARQI